jgi:RND family efflux transporter MFP subunit
VKSGQLIGRIDDAEYQQAVIEAEANLKIAGSSLIEAGIQFELARQERERVETLQAKGIASPAELDAAVSNYSAQESRLDLATAQVEQREASLAAARIRLGYTRLAASKPGFIGQRFVDEGALLAPNAAVVSVVGIDSVIVRATVTERDYGAIQPGQSVEVTVDAFPNQQFIGDVARVAPLLDEASRVAEVEVEIANEQRLLKPGMFARAAVQIAHRDSVQTVPTQALVSRNGHPGVFTVAPDCDITQFVLVTVGISTSTQTEILSPQIEGSVVTLGQHLLEDGSPVLVPTEGERAEGRESGRMAPS